MDGVIELHSGRIEGLKRNGVWSFSGIPYAAPPTGARRWRPPIDPEPWAGIRPCVEFGPIAPQTLPAPEWSLAGETEEQSEDCLSVNVWTPGLDGSRPVMVWVHGGAFVTGSGSSGLTRGGLLAREEDVVVVTLNYRLGLLGFLAHPALDEAGQPWLDGRAWSGWGNWGLADQIAALRWVAEHISSFGGDPANVTLFGESAGGMAVSDLLAAPAAQGLFHRAIVESGPPATFTATGAISRAEQCADLLGVPMTREALCGVPAEQLVQAVASVAGPTSESEPGLAMMPAVDGGLLPEAPLDAVAAGASSEVPLLVGTTRDEFTFFMVSDPKAASMDAGRLQRWVDRLVSGSDRAEAVIAAVEQARRGRAEPVSPRDVWTSIATEYVFRAPSIRLADAHAATGPAGGAETYVYLFTYETPTFGGALGSCHGLEIPFVFGTVAKPAVQAFSGGGEDALSLSKVVRGAWGEFARTGRLGDWIGWDPDRRPTEVLGPWPDRSGFRHHVERPRDEELEAVLAIRPR